MFMDLSNSVLKSTFYYKNGLLYWKRKTSRKVRPNTVAGHKKPNGYCQFKLSGHIHSTHRAIYTIFYGDIPDGYEIDHIDGDPSNNRIENLRCVTRQGNMTNLKVGSRNTSGMVGVSRHRNGRWYAQISRAGMHEFLGYFDTFNQAARARLSAEHRLGFITHKRRLVA